MSHVLGWDISTSVVGWTSMGSDGVTIAMGHVDFKKCNTLWEKADRMRDLIPGIIEASGGVPDAFFIEESLQKFSTGMSSANTINILTKFNGICSYLLRNELKMEPRYISVNHARKLCGIKIQRTKVCGKNGKEQTFEWAVNGPLKEIALGFTKTKTGKIQGYHYDEVDSWVIARAGISEIASGAPIKLK